MPNDNLNVKHIFVSVHPVIYPTISDSTGATQEEVLSLGVITGETGLHPWGLMRGRVG